MRGILYRFTENAIYLEGITPRPWAPNKRKIGDLIDALTGICLLPNEIDQPSWLNGEATIDGIIVSVKNGCSMWGAGVSSRMRRHTSARPRCRLPIIPTHPNRGAGWIFWQNSGAANPRPSTFSASGSAI